MNADQRHDQDKTKDGISHKDAHKTQNEDQEPSEFELNCSLLLSFVSLVPFCG
jgi:hypothetical protein